jgi:hypothetical protein
MLDDLMDNIMTTDDLLRKTEGSTVEPLYKHIIGNRIRMLIREVCLYKGN